MLKFIKINSINGTIYVININAIAFLKEENGHAIVTLNAVDKNKVNVQIIDIERNLQDYDQWLFTDLNNS